MSENAWKKIWAKKKELADGGSVLSRLIPLDGDAKRVGAVQEDDWRRYVQGLSERMGVESGDSLFDIGCGAGAFLYPLWEKKHQVGGIDYSPSQVAIASEALPGAEILLGDALECPTEPHYDHVFSHGVFFYYSDLEYAERCLDIMTKKALKTVSVFFTPDAEQRDGYIKARRDDYPKGVYDTRFQGLEHLCYARSWFSKIAQKLNLDEEFFTFPLEGYRHNRFIYHAVLKKRV